MRKNIPVVMTIAGSDSGGGAGIQADLKTFAALGVFGTSAIACLTAQNPSGVAKVSVVDPRMVSLQMKMIVEAFPIAAAKTGMLYSSALIAAVARAAVKYRLPRLVVDPVMIATSGSRLLRVEAFSALCSMLLPQALVVTPNLSEAERLFGRRIRSIDEMIRAAGAIAERFHCACVVKGGHLAGNTVADVLWQNGQCHVFHSKRLKVTETHGTGCTFSAALTAYIALGYPLKTAVQKARGYVQQALRHAFRAGVHRPLYWPMTRNR